MRQRVSPKVHEDANGEIGGAKDAGLCIPSHESGKILVAGRADACDSVFMLVVHDRGGHAVLHGGFSQSRCLDWSCTSPSFFSFISVHTGREVLTAKEGRPRKL